MTKGTSKLQYNPGFAPVPYKAMRDASIGIDSRGLLAMLITHSPEWKFNRKDVIKKCNCGKAKYDRMVSELKSAGYLEIIPEQTEDGKFSGEYTWIIHAEPKNKTEMKSDNLDNAENMEIELSENMEIGKPAPISNNNSIKERKVKEPPNPQRGNVDIDEIFDKLWLFIKKCTPDDLMGRHSKIKGRAKFKKIATRKKDPIPAGQMAHAICWYYASPDQQREEGKFVKGIMPVLNGELFHSFLDRGPYGSKAEASPEELAKDKTSDYWEFHIERYSDQGDWGAPGPDPASPDCLAPKDILEKFGFGDTA